MEISRVEVSSDEPGNFEKSHVCFVLNSNPAHLKATNSFFMEYVVVSLLSI